MTDSKFTAEYQSSVNDVIEKVILPTDYKSKILSALREQAKIEEAKETNENIETEITDTEIKETPETKENETKIISIESAKTKKQSKVKRYISIIASAAAAIVIIASTFLINNTGITNTPQNKQFNFSVASATNLSCISGAKVTFKGSDGEIIKDEDGNPVTAYSDEEGNISVTLPEADSYIAMISAEGYIPYEASVDSNFIYISPVMDEHTYRAVLTWENTCDLDAILTVTKGDKSEQLYYFNSYIYDENDEIIAALDTDSSTADSPETITFNTTDDGIFRFSVASYSALTTTNPSDLGPSKAKVTLYRGDKLIETFHVNPETEDNTWCVLEIRDSNLHIINSTYSVEAIPEVY